MLYLIIAILPDSLRQDSKLTTEFDSLARRRVAQGNHEKFKGWDGFGPVGMMFPTIRQVICCQRPCRESVTSFVTNVLQTSRENVFLPNCLVVPKGTIGFRWFGRHLQHSCQLNQLLSNQRLHLTSI